MIRTILRWAGTLTVLFVIAAGMVTIGAFLNGLLHP